MLPRFRLRRKGRVPGGWWGCSPEPVTLAQAVGKPWARAGAHLGLRKEGWGCWEERLPRAGQGGWGAWLTLLHTPLVAPLPRLNPALLGLPRAARGCQGHGDAGAGLWWDWDWSAVVLGAGWRFGAQP